MTRRTISATQNAVRVIGVRRELYVDFEFIAGDPLLTVELIMPLDAFQEFCATRQAIILPTSKDAQEAFSSLCMRSQGKPHIRVVK